MKQLNGRPVRFGAANKGMQDTGEALKSDEELYNKYLKLAYSVTDSTSKVNDSDDDEDDDEEEDD